MATKDDFKSFGLNPRKNIHRNLMRSLENWRAGLKAGDEAWTMDEIDHYPVRVKVMRLNREKDEVYLGNHAKLKGVDLDTLEPIAYKGWEKLNFEHLFPSDDWVSLLSAAFRMSDELESIDARYGKRSKERWDLKVGHVAEERYRMAKRLQEKAKEAT